MAKKTSRPGRTLLIFFISVAVLYGLAALGGTFKPKLGLDLAGGTRITLTADSKGVNATKLKQAKSIIESRVNGTGVVEPDITVQGGKNIVVEIPGKNARDLIDQVKRTAQLRFRLVAHNAVIPATTTTTTTSTPSPSGSPSATPTGKATPGAKVSPSGSPTATQSGSANRTAPKFARDADGTPTPTPTPTAGATPTTPLTDTVLPSTKGDDLTATLKWAANPPTAWQQQLISYTCPVKGKKSTPVADNPDEPLVTCDSSGNKYLLSKAVVEGTSLKKASAGIPQQQASWVVNLELKGSAVKTFATVSRALLANGDDFAVVLDGVVLSAPGFDGVINNGSAQISGSFNEKSATALANSLKFGALPVKFNPTAQVEVIGPSLAGDQLSAGVLAGIIGLLIVMIYCLFYYRGLGLVVIASLFVAAGVTYGTVLVLAKAAGFTLTLPGIAGLIVAVGITADSFIVYFERIRDEMRDGKSMRVAVEAGWIRARNTCLAADAVSLLASVVLYIFAIGVVRGFAFALGVSTLIDIVVFFWFTKPTVTLLAKRPFFNSGHRLSGLSAETLGVDALAGHTATVGGKA
ncbi:MAG: protein translocase subunit SecD, partial [Marmoricola sp.]